MSYPVCVSKVLIERRSSPLRRTELPGESRPLAFNFFSTRSQIFPDYRAASSHSSSFFARCELLYQNGSLRIVLLEQDDSSKTSC
jgi:hypothetical protein